MGMLQTFDVKIFANEIKAVGDIDKCKKVYIRIDRKPHGIFPNKTTGK